MNTVETVKGPVDASALGATLMHEHLFVLSPEFNQNYPRSWGDEALRVERAVRQLRALKNRGIDSFVDLTVLGAGRFIPRIQALAAQVDINILVATGLYIFDALPPFLQSRNPGGRYDVTDTMAGLFLSDIRDGIAGTGVKAAILKCATDRQGVTWGVERVLRAVARVHRDTGVPISTHAHAGSQQGLEQQRLLREEGVDLTRVVIGHCGDTIDFAYLDQLIQNGSYIGMDRFGLHSILPFKKRVDAVAKLCSRGLAGRIVLSHDAASYMDWIDEDAVRSAFPDWNFNHIPDHVIPALKKRGVSDDQIHAMMVDNPRHILECRER